MANFPHDDTIFDLGTLEINGRDGDTAREAGQKYNVHWHPPEDLLDLTAFLAWQAIPPPTGCWASYSGDIYVWDGAAAIKVGGGAGTSESLQDAYDLGDTIQMASATAPVNLVSGFAGSGEFFEFQDSTNEPLAYISQTNTLEVSFEGAFEGAIDAVSVRIAGGEGVINDGGNVILQPGHSSVGTPGVINFLDLGNSIFYASETYVFAILQLSHGRASAIAAFIRAPSG